MRSRGVSIAHDGEELRYAGWSGPGGFEKSPGYELKITPMQRDGFLDMAVEGRFNVAYGPSDAGPRPFNRNRFSANVTMEKTPDGWLYEQTGLPDGGTFRATFIED